MRVIISGATLASAMLDAVTSPDREGLVYGTFSSTTTTLLQDEGAATVTDREDVVIIQRLITTGTSCSFYNTKGEIIVERLPASPNPSQVLLGWFRARKNTPLRPSLREMAVHANISRHIDNLPTTTPAFRALFALFTSGVNNNVISQDHVFYTIQSAGESTVIECVPTSIPNIVQGSAEEYASYQSLGSSGGFVAPQALVGMPPAIVTGVENACVDMLARVQEMTKRVAASDARVAELEREKGIPVSSVVLGGPITPRAAGASGFAAPPSTTNPELVGVFGAAPPAITPPASAPPGYAAPQTFENPITPTGGAVPGALIPNAAPPSYVGAPPAEPFTGGPPAAPPPSYGGPPPGPPPGAPPGAPPPQ